MKNLLIILGFIILTSATTVSIMTVKPATPIGSLTAYFEHDLSSNAGVKACKWIKKMTMDGWIMKQHSIADHYILVTMEKY